MVIWIIGLSGAGKSTLALEVANRARHSISNVVLLDGDMVREVWGSDLGHDLKDRKKNAERLCRLCKLLDSQGIHVVCAVLSLFEESREWNREHLSDYFEVYIKASLKDLKDRDPKGLYAKALSGEIELPGVNLPFADPLLPDLVIGNYGDRQELLSHAANIAQKLVEP